MSENNIISAYENDFGVTVHTIVAQDSDTTAIDVRTYEPDHENFNWALNLAQQFTNQTS